MTNLEPGLGGQLALLAPHTLSTHQRALYDQLLAKTVAWAQQSGFKAVNENQQLIGPFNVLLRSPASGQAIRGVDAALRQHASLSEPLQQAAYELYAYIAVARQAGLAEDAIQALAAGALPTGLSTEVTLAYQLTQAIVTNHQLGTDLYKQGLKTFGKKGWSISWRWRVST